MLQRKPCSCMAASELLGGFLHLLGLLLWAVVCKVVHLHLICHSVLRVRNTVGYNLPATVTAAFLLNFALRPHPADCTCEAQMVHCATYEPALVKLLPRHTPVHASSCMKEGLPLTDSDMSKHIKILRMSSASYFIEKQPATAQDFLHCQALNITQGQQPLMLKHW